MRQRMPCSRPIGLATVPAMGTFYFIVAPCFRGFVSADRLSRARHAALTNTSEDLPSPCWSPLEKSQRPLKVAELFPESVGD